jgi:Arc/MetJ-type ribon-helix-helix transcriptional regulator
VEKATKGNQKTHVSVRLAQSQIDRIDALAKRCSTRWRDETRSDVLRFLLIQSLERMEQNEALIVEEFHRANAKGTAE